MSEVVEIVLGLAFGAAALVAVRSADRLAHRLLAVGVIGLPFVYAVFKLVDGRVGEAGLELLVGVPFIATGLWLVSEPPNVARWLGVAWLAHGIFDGVRHLFLTEAGVPGWYPLVCLGTDVAIGLYLLAQSQRVATPAPA